MNRTATAAFMIGVTGNMDLRPEEAPILQERVRQLFRFLKSTPKQKDRKSLLNALVAQLPDDGVNSAARDAYATALQQWPGLVNTPVIVLSALAPGADTLVANVAGEAEFQQAGFSVRAVLPFPPDLYRDASTFVQEKAGQPDPKNAQRQADYDQALKTAEDAFAVSLEEDYKPLAEPLRAVFERDRGIQERRRLRYYAAGEYMAVYSHLLIAVWDQHFDFDTAVGTAAVVEARLRGPRHGVLPTTSGLALPHGGPLVHLYTRREKNTNDRPPEECWTLRLLHPVRNEAKNDASPKSDSNPLAPKESDAFVADLKSQEHDAKLQQKHLALFCRIGTNLDSFNSTSSLPNDQRIDAELDKRLPFRWLKHDVPFWKTLRATEHTREFYEKLRYLVALRRGVGDENANLDQRKSSTLVSLFWLSFFAAAFLHLFAHWHPQAATHAAAQAVSHCTDEAHAKEGAAIEDHSQAHRSWLRPAFGLIALALAFSGLILFWWRNSISYAERAHDCRALAEALRVQLYWDLVGLGRSVSANYMNRQRSELDWIRGAVRALSFPYERGRDHFGQLDRSYKIAALRCALLGWVCDQEKYFTASAKKNHGFLHFWHKLGGLFALTGIWIVLALSFSSMSATELQWLECHLPLVLGVAVLLPVIGILNRFLRAAADQEQGEAQGKPKTIRQRLEGLLNLLVPTADPHSATFSIPTQRRGKSLLNFLSYLPLSISLAAFGLSLCVWLAGLTYELPSAFDLAIVSGGWCLLAGAMAVAWAEKNLYSEFAYQYSTMLGLFQNARGRLELDLKRLESQQENDEEFTKTLGEIQDCLFSLGKEALDENAEWLILHRARPLEPVMA